MNPTHVPAALAVLAVLAVPACGAGAPSSDTAADPAGTTTAAPPSAPSPAPPSTSHPTPSAEPARHGGWLATVPDGLWLDAGLPQDGGDFARGSAGVGLEPCGDPATGARPVDVRRVSASGPEYGESHELRLFADQREARHLLTEIEEAVDQCPAQEHHGTTWRHELRPSTLAPLVDAAYVVTRTYADGEGRPLLGATFWEVAQVGNAVLLTETSGEYAPTTALDPGIRHHAGEVAVIAESLCVFAADPCAAGPRLGGSPLHTVVAPAGLGNIALGASANEIEAFGGEVTDRTTGSGCRVVDLWVNDAPDLSGNLDPDLGLAVIHATTAGPARTDRGVGIGSSYAEVVAAYPRGEGDEVLWSAPAAAYDDRHWRFWFDRDGRLDELMLLLDDQHCGG